MNPRSPRDEALDELDETSSVRRIDVSVTVEIDPTDDPDAADGVDDPPPSSSAVRVATLARHQEVRLVLARGLDAVRAVRAHEAGAAQRLEAAAVAIAAVVHYQILAEDRGLGPVLATLDAWGPQRLEALESIHEEERAALDRAFGQGELARADVLEEAIRTLVRVLRTEEEALLDPDTLDDSTIVNPWQGGS